MGRKRDGFANQIRWYRRQMNPALLTTRWPGYVYAWDEEADRVAFDHVEHAGIYQYAHYTDNAALLLTRPHIPMEEISRDLVPLTMQEHLTKVLLTWREQYGPQTASS